MPPSLVWLCVVWSAAAHAAFSASPEFEASLGGAARSNATQRAAGRRAVLWSHATDAPEPPRRVVFVKTYKTGSTTVSEFLASVGYDLGLRSLHPLEGGNFRAGELARRAARGARFDLSYRHPTPHLDVAALSALLPAPVLWVSIIREPVSRFVSTLLFVKRVAERFGYSSVKLVAAIRARKLPDGDANTFCNNFAWVLSGEARSLAYADAAESASHAAVVKSRVRELGGVVLLQHRMEDSLALLAHYMSWDMRQLSGRVGTARARPPAKGAAARASCEDAACRSAVLSCNAIDQELFAHFSTEFDALLADAGPGLEEVRAALQSPPGGARRPEIAKRYPINCQTPGEGPADRQRWKLLHSCNGHPN